ncbi:uncharacterized protein H6S33_003026, partial [Morchella sextelata]|uniref:uncharacterized protein n=1 Tax=Morchella sextelata TaxID=1174677 RepID=UPI001D04A3D7
VVSTHGSPGEPGPLVRLSLYSCSTCRRVRHPGEKKKRKKEREFWIALEAVEATG